MNLSYPHPSRTIRERQTATHLARVLPAAEADGLITSWFFIRKGAWRVRYLLTAEQHSRISTDTDPVHRLLTDGIDAISDVYEPEVHAFGGPGSMTTAHTLFHGDSRHILPFLTRSPAAERQERSLVLCTALMRAAGLDLNEQGDVWARVADQRTGLRGALPDPQTWTSYTGDVRRLLLGTASPGGIAASWITVFEDAGRRLKALREEGRLTRGIRAVMALHVLFHWNRIGIAGATQARLALAAKEAVFNDPQEEESSPARQDRRSPAPAPTRPHGTEFRQ